MTKTALLIFPHQLFADHPGLSDNPDQVHVIEDSLFFGDRQYPVPFHKQKLWLHRATMKQFTARAEADGFDVTYHDHDGRGYVTRRALERAAEAGVNQILTTHPHDYTLEKRLANWTETLDLSLRYLETPMFLNTTDQNEDWREGQNRWFMAEYYKAQRRRLNVMMDGDDPRGGKWSFDEENRKKIPKNRLGDIPSLTFPKSGDIEEEARSYVTEKFADNPGSLERLFYPTTPEAAADWLDRFCKDRLPDFGPYEDAIEAGENWLWHSILTPMLNTGLLTPQQVLDRVLEAARENDIPLNSLEGFVRQIIGWREFMRATYEALGVSMRSTNHWKHTRPIPESFWTGETGIDPIDDTIRRLLETGYCHHIERLMVLGGFMFLCEFDPDEIYEWFMAMFIDSYDWVMVPNAYAMSQNADGGQITTKPYFSGSAYVRKMSHWKEGEWSKIWDGLYWRWIWQHREALGSNPRWAMMVSTAKKMDEAKREAHLQTAANYLRSLG